MQSFPEEIFGAVLDFDDTLTNGWAEGGRTYFPGYRDDVGAYLLQHASSIPGLNPKTFDIKYEWKLANNVRRRNPKRNVWIVNGFVVAPATDPLMAATANMHIIFDKFGVIPDPEQRHVVGQRFYESNYKKTKTVFRESPEAVASFLEDLLEQMEGRVVVVSNSGTTGVSKKIEQLGRGLLDRIKVYGGAKKMENHKDWDGVVESYDGVIKTVHPIQPVAGLGRSVVLQRKHYGLLLGKISQDFGVPLERMGVLGDNYDLDLSVPWTLDMRTCLMLKKRTQLYETKLASTTAANIDEARVFYGMKQVA